MADETKCPSCNTSMVVEAAMRGRPVRCPTCSSVVVAGAEDPPAEASADEWRMRTPEGHIYGPITRSVMDDWMAQGRISDDCELCGEDRRWHPASDVYAVLQPPPIEATAVHPEATTHSPFAPTSNLRPHRGTLILVLGIMGWIACPVFSIAAWVMGTADLKEMREGRMDKEGASTTYTGQILGMVHSVLTIIIMLVIVFGLIGRATFGF